VETSIRELLKHKQEGLAHSLNWKAPHPTSKGDNSELSWIGFFEGFLPSRYRIAKGFVFDSRGGCSEQIDVIVYDGFHSPLISKTSNGEVYVTAESVYAVFEVKPEFDKANLKYADDKIASARCLHRTSRDMISSGNVVPPTEPRRIIGGVLGLDSMSPKTLGAHLERYENIDLGCILNRYTFLARGLDGSLKEPIRYSSSEESVLAFYYLLLDQLHQRGTVPAIDIREYAGLALDTFELERGNL